MSLRDAVLEVVEEMETGPGDNGFSTMMYAKMLRIALKSSEGEERIVQAVVPPPQMPGFLHDRLMIERAKEEFRNPKGRADAEEGAMGKQTELVGGPNYDPKVPTYMEVGNAMPVGARTWSEGGIYELKDDGRLHFVPTAATPA